MVSTLSPLGYRRFESLGSHVGCGQLGVAAEEYHNIAIPVCVPAVYSTRAVENTLI